MAQAYGIKVRDITLLPIGGVASMEEIPEDPKQEFLIAVAGPMSNLLLGLLMLAGAVAFLPRETLSSFDQLRRLMLTPSAQGAYVYLMVVNFTLALFNLLPAYPMDGGRVFRSLLAMHMDRARASRIAVGVGQVLALLLGLLGFLTGNFFMILVAIFVFFGAQSETAGSRVQKTLGDLRVSQAVTTHLEVADPDQVVGDLATRLFHSYQTDFPVLDQGRLVGLVTRDRLISTLGHDGARVPVSQAMVSDYPTATLDDRVYDALVRMRTKGFKAMPVVDGTRFVGMVSMEDISEVYSLLAAAGPDFGRAVPDEGLPAGEDSALGDVPLRGDPFGAAAGEERPPEGPAPWASS